jgi:hypothetical protein
LDLDCDCQLLFIRILEEVVMSVQYIIGSVMGVAVMFAAVMADARTTIPNTMELDPDVAAVYHREKARQGIAYNQKKKKSSSYSSDSDYDSDTPCGSVAINSNNSSGAVQDSLKKPNVTVITGPVINAANCK